MGLTVNLGGRVSKGKTKAVSERTNGRSAYDASKARVECAEEALTSPISCVQV